MKRKAKKQQAHALDLVGLKTEFPEDCRFFAKGPSCTSLSTPLKEVTDDLLRVCRAFLTLGFADSFVSCGTVVGLEACLRDAALTSVKPVESYSAHWRLPLMDPLLT